MASEVGVLDIAAGAHSAQRPACSRAACSWWTPRKAASSPTRRSSRRSPREHPYREWLDKYHGRAGRPAGAAASARADHRNRAAAAAGVRLHVRRFAHSSWRRWRATASKPSARWARTRRWRCCRTSRSCSTIISSSSSRRSPTRRLIASARKSITSTETTIGSEGNLLKPTPESCRLIELKSPILTNEEFAKLGTSIMPGFKSVTLPILFKVGGWRRGLGKRDGQICSRAPDKAIADGVNILILSDRGIDRENAPIPALLAVAGLASSSDPRRHAHARRPGARIRRTARSASFLAAHRLRLRARSIRIWRSRRSTT